jgi:Mg-chelatase subunit ChlI
VHNFIAEEEATLEADGGKKTAELDHMDGMDTQPTPPDGEGSADVEEPEENLQMMPDGETDSSDEEAEDEERAEPSEAEGPKLQRGSGSGSTRHRPLQAPSGSMGNSGHQLRT